MNYLAVFKSPIGNIYVKNDEKNILETGLTVQECFFKGNSLTEEAVKQLKEYFFSGRRCFDLPLNPAGTEFQKKVWSELIKIPYGQTASYKDIAVKTGNPNAARAVGNANNKNPIFIIIPCHRVIGTNKKLTGYSLGLDIKQALLSLEKT